MNLVMLVIVGGIIGWAAGLIVRTNAWRDLLLNLVVGIAGALFAGLVVTPLIGGASIADGAPDITSTLISLSGAIALLAIVNLVRRGRVR